MGPDLALLGFEPRDAALLGRLIVSGGKVQRIVEARDASAEELTVRTCYAGHAGGAGGQALRLAGKGRER